MNKNVTKFVIHIRKVHKTIDMTTIENIKDLYGKVNDKHKFLETASKEFGRKPASIKKNWLCDSGFWSVPEDCKGKLIDLLQKQIQIQNEKK